MVIFSVGVAYHRRTHRLLFPSGVDVLKSIGILLTGGVMAQAILFVGQVFLARVYIAPDFGVFAQLVALSTMAFMIGSFQLHQALVLPDDENESVAILVSGLGLSLSFCSVAFLAMHLFRDFVFAPAVAEQMPLLFLLLSIELCLINMLRGWQTARNRFSILSLHAISRAVAIVVMQLIFGVVHLADGLLWGAIAGELLGIVLLLALSRFPTSGLFSQLVRIPKIALGCFWKYRSFSIVGTLQETISSGGFLLPMYLFPRLYDASAGGQFAMVQKIAWSPILLLASSAAQVYYHRLSRAGVNLMNDPDLLLVGKGRVPVIVTGIALMFAAPTVLRLVLGPGWELAAEMSRWYVLWGVFFVLAIPYRVCVRVLQLQRYQLVVDTLFMLGIIALFFFAARFMNPLAIFACMALLGVLQNLALYLIIKTAMARSAFSGNIS